MDQCKTFPRQIKRPFWATQPCACGVVLDSCGNSCCQPGLEFVDEAGRRSIRTNDWIRGLVLNILNTDKRVADSLCGVNPTAIKGHWSESFIDASKGLYGGADKGYRVGTSIRQIKVSTMRTQEILAHLEAALKTDLQKLVTLGVAVGIDVTIEYAGGGRFAAEIVIYGPNAAPATRVALIGSRDTDIGYYWST